MKNTNNETVVIANTQEETDQQFRELSDSELESIAGGATKDRCFPEFKGTWGF